MTKRIEFTPSRGEEVVKESIRELSLTATKEEETELRTCLVLFGTEGVRRKARKMSTIGGTALALRIEMKYGPSLDPLTPPLTPLEAGRILLDGFLHNDAYEIAPTLQKKAWATTRRHLSFALRALS